MIIEFTSRTRTQFCRIKVVVLTLYSAGALNGTLILISLILTKFISYNKKVNKHDNFLTTEKLIGTTAVIRNHGTDVTTENIVSVSTTTLLPTKKHE